jgi:hypothetical protein
MSEKNSKNLLRQGFLQATGVSLYASLIGLLFWKGEAIFGGGRPNYFGPVTFLILFSVSVLICGLFVFYQPYLLFFEAKKRQAADLILFTTIWLFIFFLAFLMLTVAS